MQNLTNIIKNLEVKIAEYFKNDATGHNIDHLHRVLNYALHLQSKEGGDIIVVAVSAFIHDIHRIMSNAENRYVSPKESLPIVAKFIENLDITDNQNQHILYAVEHHEEYAWEKGGVTVADIESKILQDADNLDAIGVMGVIRAFKYGNEHGRVDYDPNTPLYTNEFSESGPDDASTIHHIYNKLMRLGQNMNTESAKKLAQQKTDFMKSFIDLYINEHNGKF